MFAFSDMARSGTAPPSKNSNKDNISPYLTPFTRPKTRATNDGIIIIMTIVIIFIIILL